MKCNGVKVWNMLYNLVKQHLSKVKMLIKYRYLKMYLRVKVQTKASTVRP